MDSGRVIGGRRRRLIAPLRNLTGRARQSSSARAGADPPRRAELD